jgi:hypothetical protein
MKSATWQTARKEKAAWQNMLNRCRNPRTKDWKNYGGRGVVVCDRWRSWDAFICDVGFAPSPEHTLDRKDNDGNYEPGNVRWTLPSVQGLNRREQSHQAAYETKVERPHLVYGRIRKGMTLAQALADATEALATARRP